VGVALRPRLQAVAELPLRLPVGVGRQLRLQAVAELPLRLPVGVGRQLRLPVGVGRQLPLRVAAARLRLAVVALPRPVARQGEEAGQLPRIAVRRQVTEMPWAVVLNRIMPGWNTGPMAVKFRDEQTGNPETSMSPAAMGARWISIMD
jgi:hypothetical protein